MWKKAIVGGQRKKHQQRPRHACTLQSQPQYLNFHFCFTYLMFLWLFGVPESHLTIMFDQRLKDHLRPVVFFLFVSVRMLE